jgi:hypothetical protein
MFDFDSLNLMRAESVCVPPDRLHSVGRSDAEDVARDQGDLASDSLSQASCPVPANRP